MTWLPFESADMLEVNVTTSEANGAYSLEIRCVSSRVGDIARFCYYVGSNVLWVSSPMDDDGVPVYPVQNSDGATRCDKIRIVVDTDALLQTTLEGILADLDEYVRSKKALQDMVPAETYVI